MEIILDSAWLAPPEDLTLRSDDVHVWCASLDCATPLARILQDLLAPDELDRAGRFRFNEDRRRFIAARGLLRIILGRYLDLGPARLCFVYNDHGKPTLSPSSRNRELNFNLSHACGLLLVAVTQGREIGVDVEAIRPLPDLAPIAERFFSDPEKKALQSLRPAERLEAFFKFWTCKEAYIKAKGKGLSLPLDQFHVALISGEPDPLLRVPRDPKEASRWSLRHLTCAPGYAAALAVEGTDWRLARWCYDGKPDFVQRSKPAR